jgi:hypothetical protein
MSSEVKTILDELIRINFGDDALIEKLIGKEGGEEMTEHQSAALEEVQSCLQATLKTLKVARAAFWRSDMIEG